MSKTEWKEFYRAVQEDCFGDNKGNCVRDIESYNKAEDEGKKRFGIFRVEKYFKQVEVSPVYEYQVLYKSSIVGDFLITFNEYFTSKEDFLARYSNLEFIELIQATKRERK